MIWPVSYDTKSQDFGAHPTANNPDPVFGNYQPDGHTGIDFAVPVGTVFVSCAAGTVLHVGWYSGSYADNPEWIAPNFAGWCYVVDHGQFLGIYAHGQEGGNLVNQGDTVTEGQPLGHTGNTGGSTGPHLHFETLPDGWVVNSKFYGRVDPHNYIDGVTISPLAADIINTLQEAGVALELKDLQAIQGFCNTSEGRIIADTRAQIAAAKGDIIAAIAKGNYDVKVFTQLVDNGNADRVITDTRSQIASIRKQ